MRGRWVMGHWGDLSWGLHQPICSYEVRFPIAEADGNAHEPRHPVAEPLGYNTGVGKSELSPVPVGAWVEASLRRLDGEVTDHTVGSLPA